MTGCGVTCNTCPLASLCGDPLPAVDVDVDAPDRDPAEPEYVVA